MYSCTGRNGSCGGRRGVRLGVLACLAVIGWVVPAEAVNAPAEVPVHSARFELLPDAVRRVTVDRNGRAWFARDVDSGRPDEARTDALQKSVEKAWGATGREVVFGRVLTLDRGGRLWLLQVTSPEFTLYGYDGKTWVVRQVEDVPHPAPLLAAGAKDETPLPAFNSHEFAEDDAGNFFISDGLGVFRHGADGKWDYLATYGDQPSVYEGSKYHVFDLDYPPGMRPRRRRRGSASTFRWAVAGRRRWCGRRPRRRPIRGRITLRSNTPARCR